MGLAAFETEGIRVEVELPDDQVMKMLREVLSDALSRDHKPKPRAASPKELFERLAKKNGSKLPLCACGCGKRVRSRGAKFLRGHNKKARELRQKKSETIKLSHRDEKEILRAYYVDKVPIEKIAAFFGISVEQVEAVVTSEKGQRYARVNAGFDEEKLRKALKDDLEIKARLCADAEGQGHEALGV